MIKEAYVSFEVAKLLKNKGFNESCYTYYNDIDNSINRFDKGLHFNNTSFPWGVPYDISEAKKYVVAPTHQMAMAWLREIHKVVISIDAHTANHWDGYIDTFEIDILINASRIIVPNEIAIHNIYEEAVEAALKYSLENLI